MTPVAQMAFQGLKPLTLPCARYKMGDLFDARRQNSLPSGDAGAFISEHEFLKTDHRCADHWSVRLQTPPGPSSPACLPINTPSHPPEGEFRTWVSLSTCRCFGDKISFAECVVSKACPQSIPSSAACVAVCCNAAEKLISLSAPASLCDPFQNANEEVGK